METLHASLRGLSRPIKLGISPFGIWRPGHPPSIDAGLDQYGMLFADPRRWLHEGWLDYCAPQLYWPISKVSQSFPVLLAWWARNNPHGRHVWPGLYTSSVRSRGWPAREIVDQIMVTRGLLQPVPGHIHFSARAVLDSARVGSGGDRLTATLAKGPYRGPGPGAGHAVAGRPASRGAPGDGSPSGPRAPAGLGPAGRGAALPLRGLHQGPRQRMAAQDRAGLPDGAAPAPRRVRGKGEVEAVAVTAVDRMGNESDVRVHPLESLL